MIPDMKACDGSKTMSPENFEKMMEVGEKLIKRGDFDSISWRLSGGEPFLAFDMYKDIVRKWKEKMGWRYSFGVLTNLVTYTDEMAKWQKDLNIGMQVSLDDVYESKPLQNGKSSAEVTMQNVQKAMINGVVFSFNTVLDVAKVKSLIPIANFVSRFKNVEWGLNASYTMKDGAQANEAIKIFKECIGHLKSNGFDVWNKLRFYNAVPARHNGTCSAGIGSCSITPDLKVHSCQSMCDQEPLGDFDENLVKLLAESDGNKLFRDRTMLPTCCDCSILDYCRGSCRATYHDKEVTDQTCRIRREIFHYILGLYQNQNQNGNCNCNQHQNHCQCQQCQNQSQSQQNQTQNQNHPRPDHGQSMVEHIEKYVSTLPRLEVETPELDLVEEKK